MDTRSMTLEEIARAAKTIESLPEKNLSLEQLERKVEALQRQGQANKDRAVAQTNKRLDAIEKAVAELQYRFLDFLRSEE